MPIKWRTIKSLVHKIRLHGRRGKGTAESFSREKLRHAPQKGGGWEILCDLPSVWPRLVRPTNLMPRINGKKSQHTHTPWGQSRVYRVTQLRTDGVHCRESAGTGPVNLKVVPNECCLGRSPSTNNMRLSFPHPLMVCSGHVESTVQRIGCQPETLGGKSRSWSAEQGNYSYFCEKEMEKRNPSCWATESDYTVQCSKRTCITVSRKHLFTPAELPKAWINLHTLNYPNCFLFRRFLAPAPPTIDSRKWNEIPIYPFESGRSTIWSDLIVETARQC